MSIRIITDSGCDQAFSEKPYITVLPLTITFGDQTYKDGVDITHREFFEKLIEGDTLPSTSQINPAQFEQAFGQAIERGEDVVAITMSSKLSGTYQSALIAAQSFEGPLYVVDSENVTLGQACLIKRACELVEAGCSAKELAEALEHEKKDIRLIALLDTLEYLKRGGRISAAAAAVGGMLSLKPVVAVADGEVVVLGKARGSRKGNNRLAEEIHKTTGVDFDRPFQLAYSGLDDHLLRKYIQDSRTLWEDHADELPISTIGATIGTHVGPGAIGVAFFQKRTDASA